MAPGTGGNAGDAGSSGSAGSGGTAGSAGSSGSSGASGALRALRVRARVRLVRLGQAQARLGRVSGLCWFGGNVWLWRSTTLACTASTRSTHTERRSA
ncbi:MAG: hypothetical protein U0165_15560 [Polyangiaceae bacterium]